MRQQAGIPARMVVTDQFGAAAQLTGKQYAHVMGEYNAFQHRVRNSIVQVHTETASVPGGGRVEMRHSFGVNTVRVMVPMVPAELKKTVVEPPGGIVLFYESGQFYRLWLDGEWRFEGVVSGYCGAGVYKNSLTKQYFCDNFGVYEEQQHWMHSTKFGASGMSGETDPSTGISARMGGYLFKLDSPKNIACGIISNLSKFVYFTTDDGENYSLLGGESNIKISDSPKNISNVLSSGSLHSGDYYIGLKQEIKRTTDGYFLIPLKSNELGDYSAPAKGFAIEIARACTNLAFGNPMYYKYVRLMKLDSKPPFSLLSNQFEISEFLRHDGGITFSRKKSVANTGTVSGAIGGVFYLYRVNNSESMSYRSSASLVSWLRECVDFFGNTYSAKIQSIINIDDSSNTSGEANTAHTYHPAGYGGHSEILDNKSHTTQAKINNIKTKFYFGEHSIDLIDIDVNASIKTAFARVTNPFDKILLNNASCQISGRFFARTIAAFNDKSYITCIDEIEYKDMSIKPNVANKYDWFYIKAKATKIFRIFHKGENIYSSERIELGEGILDVSYVAFDKSVIPSNEIEPLQTTEHVIASGDPPFTESVYDQSQSWDVSKIKGIRTILDYTSVVIHKADNTQVLFAIDPQSGGCAVICDKAKILVSPDGSVTEISSATGLNSDSLDFWCASA